MLNQLFLKLTVIISLLISFITPVQSLRQIPIYTNVSQGRIYRDSLLILTEDKRLLTLEKKTLLLTSVLSLSDDSGIQLITAEQAGYCKVEQIWNALNINTIISVHIGNIVREYTIDGNYFLESCSTHPTFTTLNSQSGKRWQINDEKLSPFTIIESPKKEIEAPKGFKILDQNGSELLLVDQIGLVWFASD